jgi:hypothetical protein
MPGPPPVVKTVQQWITAIDAEITRLKQARILLSWQHRDTQTKARHTECRCASTNQRGPKRREMGAAEEENLIAQGLLQTRGGKVWLIR